jgi:hypothetical protein
MGLGDLYECAAKTHSRGDGEYNENIKKAMEKYKEAIKLQVCMLSGHPTFC